MKRQGDWAQTYTGKEFWPLDPRPNEVDIRDIAHALSLQCRFNGHCESFYSVAQHSILVSKLVRPSEALPGLLHDATEAYMGDIVRPLKIFLPNIKKIEEKLERVIFEHFDIGDYDRREVHHADNLALLMEMRDLMKKPPRAWNEMKEYGNQIPIRRIRPFSPRKSERLFLERYRQLISK